MNRTFLKSIPAAILLVLILILSWYGRAAQTIIREILGLQGLLMFVCLASVIFVFVGMKILRLRQGYIRLLLLLYPSGIFILRANPEEAVHLMEYGAFAVSLSLIFADSYSQKRNYLYSVLGASILGIMDEGLQGINPTRVFDVRDIIINVIGAAVTAALFYPRKNVN